MKMANLDRIYNWLLTNEKLENIEIKNPTKVEVRNEKYRVVIPGKNTDRTLPLFYFADICAGPGGFTEYVLWRKGFYNAKGFGMTLKGGDFFNFIPKYINLNFLFFETDCYRAM